VITIKATQHLSFITSISSDGNYIVTGGDDTCVVLWKIEEKKISFVNTLFAHTDVVQCTAIDTKYGIVVSCDRKSMIISLLPHLDFLRVIELNFEVGFIPYKIIVLTYSGYIVIAAKDKRRHQLLIYSINGRYINSVTFLGEFYDFCGCSDSSGIDYLLIQFNPKEIKLYDSYYLREIQTQYTSENETICAFYYDKESNLINIVSKFSVTTVPFSHR